MCIRDRGTGTDGSAHYVGGRGRLPIHPIHLSTSPTSQPRAARSARVLVRVAYVTLKLPTRARRL
eukprot:4571300-Prymnesium_polylepis.3